MSSHDSDSCDDTFSTSSHDPDSCDDVKITDKRTKRTISVSKFIQSAHLNNITEWRIHSCSFCDYNCGYIIDLTCDNVKYDNGCDCTTYTKCCDCVCEYTVRQSSFQEIADHYNMNIEIYLNTDNDPWKFTEIDIE